MVDESDEEQEIPILPNETHFIEKMSLEEEQNIQNSLESIETRMKFLDEKIQMLNGASKKLVALLKSDNNITENSNIPLN